jgi:hypothetical protein
VTRGSELAEAFDAILNLRHDVLTKTGAAPDAPFRVDISTDGTPTGLFVDSVTVWAATPGEDRDTTITRMLEWATS